MRQIRVAMVALCCVFATALAAEPVVLAAASTNRALAYALEQSGVKAVTSYAASGVLARQIELGAPADLFVSANPKWMAHLVGKGLIDDASVRVLMSNGLVLIAPPLAPAWAEVSLATRLEDETFAMADPATAPVGAYGKEALTELGLWGIVNPRLVPMANTMATVSAVAAGEAQLGLVYASDAVGQPVQILWDIPPKTHSEIRYLIAPVPQGEDTAAAQTLLDYLSSDAGRMDLASHGFLVEMDP